LTGLTPKTGSRWLPVSREAGAPRFALRRPSATMSSSVKVYLRTRPTDNVQGSFTCVHPQPDPFPRGPGKTMNRIPGFPLVLDLKFGIPRVHRRALTSDHSHPHSHIASTASSPTASPSPSRSRRRINPEAPATSTTPRTPSSSASTTSCRTPARRPSSPRAPRTSATTSSPGTTAPSSRTDRPAQVRRTR